MGIEELALLVAAQQFAQAVAALLGRITPPPTNKWAAAAVAVGKQLMRQCGRWAHCRYHGCNLGDDDNPGGSTDCCRQNHRLATDKLISQEGGRCPPICPARG